MGGYGRDLWVLEDSKAVESVIQFGSSLHSKNPGDVDLCVISSRPLSLKEKIALTGSLPEKFDVSFLEDMPVHIRAGVLSRGRIVFTKKYYRILELMKKTDLEHAKYRLFLEDYHRCLMNAV